MDRVLLVTDTNYIPIGLGPAGSPFQTITDTIPGGLGTTSISYGYDALYRLADAAYTGAITATFAYVYDSVGNITAFTETVDAQTTIVTRTFDGANRLEYAVDASGTTTYTYDANGNLIELLPPGATVANPVGGLRYGYDQRNLLVSHEANPDGTSWVLQAEYVYDGGNDRLQQVDYTGAAPITTTYTNDVFGLTQVLVADDGTTQVYNLFGLDLISQDSGAEVRTLLVDGLGSVRLEMVGAVVETATTYKPYGEVLEQTGTSGTAYGFTGEQEDSATGLLYLRARYYNSSLKVFQSRDPWDGNSYRPNSLSGWTYVENNPVNLTDPSGRFPEYCKGAKSKRQYVLCVTSHYGVERPYELQAGWPIKYIPESLLIDIEGEPGCYSGPVPYRAPGYLEGVSASGLIWMGGSEVVYDFATMERQRFVFLGGGVTDSSLGVTGAQYAGYVKGFRTWRNAREDYSGLTTMVSIGVGLDFGPQPVGVGAGAAGFVNTLDPTIRGINWYLSGGASLDPVPGLDFGIGIFLYYVPTDARTQYVTGNTVNKGRLIHDIISGADSPWPSLVSKEQLAFYVPSRAFGVALALRYAFVYEDMHQ